MTSRDRPDDKLVQVSAGIIRAGVDALRACRVLAIDSERKGPPLLAADPPRLGIAPVGRSGLIKWPYRLGLNAALRIHPDRLLLDPSRYLKTLKYLCNI